MAVDYIQLQADVTAFLHRTDLAANMDLFLDLTESMINKDLRVAEMEVRSTLTVNQAFMPVPVDFIEFRAMDITFAGGRYPLENMTPQALDAYMTFQVGRPKAFAIQGKEIEFRPAADFVGSPPASYDVEMTYYGKVPGLIVNSTNEVLTNYPLIYLAGMLVTANSFVQDEAQAAKWSSIYVGEVSQANKQTSKSQYNVPTVR